MEIVTHGAIMNIKSALIKEKRPSIWEDRGCGEHGDAKGRGIGGIGERKGKWGNDTIIFLNYISQKKK